MSSWGSSSLLYCWQSVLLTRNVEADEPDSATDTPHPVYTSIVVAVTAGSGVVIMAMKVPRPSLYRI